LKKTPTRHHPMFKPANLSGFQTAAGRLVIELKTAKAIAPEHEAQIPGYLKSSRLEHGLLINFGACKFEIRKYAWTEDSPKRRQITLGHCSL
jgi:hypothetical protein